MHRILCKTTLHIPVTLNDARGLPAKGDSPEGMPSAFLLLVYATLITFAVWSCKDTVTGGGGGNDIVFPDTGQVSYSQHVQPLFNLKCAFSGCHGSDTYQIRGWDLTEYGRFAITGQNIVIAGEPDNSRLNKAIEGRTPGREMPRGNYPLPQNQIQGLRRWVLQGASQVP